MSRVLITGGASAIGRTLARQLLADPAYDVRVSDEREAPQWMREGCEIHRADLREPRHARAALDGCAHVVHLAGHPGEAAGAHTLLEYENTLHGAALRAAIEGEVERFVFVSCARVFERARLFPTPESHLAECAPPRSPRAYARLTSERLCRAAHEEHGLAFTICRPSSAYGAGALFGEVGVERSLVELLQAAHAQTLPMQSGAPAHRTLTPTHVEDVARALMLALDTPAALNEDFNVASPRELGFDEITRITWQASGAGGAEELEPTSEATANGEAARSWPAAEKAHELLGWQARVDFAEGVAEALASSREPAGARGDGARPSAGRIGSPL
jgi:UDP-glucose 4-epimerase